MYSCKHCNKTFKRKFNFSRHLKTQHNLSNNCKDFNSQLDTVENTPSKYLPDSPTNTNLIEEDDSTSIIQDDASMSNYNIDDDDSNDYSKPKRDDVEEEEEDALPTRQNKDENDIVQPERNLSQFDQSIKASAEAIKSKFNSLRKSHNILQSENESDSRSTRQKDDLSIDKNNSNETAKLTGLLQTALNILMIKELGNVSVNDENEDHMGSTTREVLKRPITLNSIDEQENDEIQTKRIKYENSERIVNDTNNVTTECDDPNVLVDTLRHLMITTEIGQQISPIIYNLNSLQNNHLQNSSFIYYREREKKRNELIETLNELKETDIGRKILLIINRLEESEIIEPTRFIDNILNDVEYAVGENDEICSINNNVSNVTNHIIKAKNGFSPLVPFQNITTIGSLMRSSVSGNGH